MRLHVVSLKRKRSGAVRRVTRDVDAARIRIGRETGSEIHLSDARILNAHAEIATVDGSPVITVAPGAELTLDNRPIPRRVLTPGDAFGIGPYELRVCEPGPDGVTTVELELARPPGDALGELRGRSRATLGETGLSMRRFSWIAFGAMVLLGATLALPLILGPRNPSVLDGAWSAGELSSAHRSMGNDCTPCHVRPFAAVADTACLECHAKIRQHFDASTVSDFREKRCTRCHVEHEGAEGGTVRSQAMCAACHSALGSRFPDSDLPDASDFGSDHPEFRPLLAGDEGMTRASAGEPLADRSGLQFSHAWHLFDPKVRLPENGLAPGCPDCHRIDARTGEMIPISMERDCRRCHRLTFESLRPERTLVHGSPEAVVIQIEDLHAAIALAGGVEETDAPRSVRRRPGTRLAPRERVEALQWAENRSRESVRTAFGASLCGQCHDVDPPQPSTAGAWTIRPVRIEGSRYPSARFPHAAHGAVACADCHDAEQSRFSSDVLLPGLATCRRCHGGESASSRVPGTCVSCHPYHGRDTPPMGPPVTATTGSGR